MSWTHKSGGTMHSKMRLAIRLSQRPRQDGFNAILDPRQFESLIRHKFQNLQRKCACAAPAKVICPSHTRLNGGVAGNPAFKLFRLDECVKDSLA